MLSFEINYLAVPVASIAAFLLGGLWYSPVLFGKAWVKAHGYTDEKVAEMQKGAGRAYAMAFVGNLLMTFVLSVLIRSLGVNGVLGGVHLALLCWFGFSVPISLSTWAFSDNKPFVLWMIDASYQLVYMAIMGAILGAWQ